MSRPKKIKDKYNSGIYVIEIDGCDKFYIGSSIKFDRRKKEHLYKLKQNKHDNQFLQKIFNKYGIDKFKFTLFIYTDPDKKYLLKLEQKIIDSYDWDSLINIGKTTGTPKGHYPDKRMFSNDDVVHIFKLASNGMFLNEISKQYNTDKSNVHGIISRSTYIDVLIDQNIILLAQKNISLNKNIKFSEEEIQIVKDKYKLIGRNKLSKLLGRNSNSIMNLAKKLGLTNNTTFWTEDVDNFIVKNYQLLGRPECAKQLNISSEKLTSRINMLKRKGIDIRINKVENSTNPIWTDEKIEFIKDNVEKGSIFLSEALKVTTDAIRYICSKNKIALGTKIWPDKDIEFLMNNYKKIGAKECSIKLNRSKDSITLKYNWEKNKNNGVLNG